MGTMVKDPYPVTKIHQQQKTRKDSVKTFVQKAYMYMRAEIDIAFGATRIKFNKFYKKG